MRGWIGICGIVLVGAAPHAARAEDPAPSHAGMVQALQKEVAALRQEVAELRAAQQHSFQESWEPAEVDALASAEPTAGSAWIDRLDLSGLAFLRYSYELDDSMKDFNEFDIDRIYLRFAFDLWETGTVHYVLEGGDVREAGGGAMALDVVTKAFFLEMRDLLYPGTYLWLGQADLPWVAYEEGLWGYRFQGTVFPDREGYMTSTDLGVGFGGPLPEEYGSWQVSLVNGEGWTGNELGKHKSFHARVTAHPFAAQDGPLANLFVAGFGAVGNYDGVPGNEDRRNRYIAQVGYRDPGRFTLVGEHLWTEDPANVLAPMRPSLAARPGAISQGEGFSIFSVLNLGLFHPDTDFERWELIGRWDHLDPDDRIRNNDHDRWIVGTSYRWNDYLQTLLNWEGVDYESGAMRFDEHRLMAQALVTY